MPRLKANAVPLAEQLDEIRQAYLDLHNSTLRYRSRDPNEHREECKAPLDRLAKALQWVKADAERPNGFPDDLWRGLQAFVDAFRGIEKDWWRLKGQEDNPLNDAFRKLSPFLPRLDEAPKVPSPPAPIPSVEELAPMTAAIRDLLAIKKADDALLSLCHEWQKESNELEHFFKAWANMTRQERGDNYTELQKWSKHCHWFNDRASTLASEVTLRFPNISPQPLLDFADTLNHFFQHWPDQWSELQPFWKAKTKAQLVVDTVSKAAELGSSRVNPQALALMANDGGNGSDADEIRLTDGVRDILQTLAEAKGRLTREQLIEAMAKAKRARGKSFVANTMPRLGRAGLVDNRQDCDPNGYAITHAGRAFLKSESLIVSRQV
jgi:hypothetical protein